MPFGFIEHDKEPLHGRGKSWLRTDVERLMRLLVIQHYLHEELFINKDEMAMAYMRVGPRANDLLSGKAKVKQLTKLILMIYLNRLVYRRSPSLLRRRKVPNLQKMQQLSVLQLRIQKWES